MKNGDRWTILNLTRTGGLRVRHARNGRIVTLPAAYVSTATELGYATTVHTAQGVTADTMHGVVTGVESRQQLYTMITRGRSANHLYVSVVGDGDPHAVIQPDSIHPRTATELLEQILARDAAPQSASTLQREHKDPAVRLGVATARYLDALHLAAEHLARPEVIASFDGSAERLLSGLTGEPAWPSLRVHPMLLAAAGADPVAELFTAAALQDSMSSGDQAAVIDSRIQEINKLIGRGPLPWLPGIPDGIASDPNWGPYLHARSRLVAQFADQVRSTAEGETPAWAAVRHTPVPAELIADVQLWRAATQVDTGDLRPTGPPQLDDARPNLPTAPRQATRRRGYSYRLAMAAATHHRSPQRHRGPIPAGTRGKVDQPHPGRLRRPPPRAVGGRRRTPARRPPRRSPLVAHPRPATANTEPGTRHPRGAPSDQAHDHDITRPAATRPPLRAASRVRPEPLKLHGYHDARDVFRWSVGEPSDQYSCGAARAGPPLHAGHTWRCVKGTFTGQLSGRVLREQATTGLPDAGRAPRSNSMVCGCPEGATTAGPPSVIRGRARRPRRDRHAARLPESAAAGQLGSVHSGVAIRTTRSLDHGNHRLWFSGGHKLAGTGGPQC